MLLILFAIQARLDKKEAMDILIFFERNLAEELVEAIDKKLEEIIDKSHEVDDPDAMGYFDSAEHLTGLGFVTLQTYLTAVYGILGIEKKTALGMGPKHECGNTVVKIVNDAANYWKHHHEWSLDKSTKRIELIEKTFESIGFPLEPVMNFGIW